ncbi:benzoylformate decarboxylase [Mangrovihabitans endophyticus]|uniref:Benzoylformate decarboxylase n=1 Tax=Mangrovihabitans endophyticus TaxID=1751298 RepID=A0A8J3C0Z2_9ACTN|nr:benzoylformate decarboxylase [Mangrovihabitans endophyticus]GGK91637.1 benzoylformate decarboxylase [Mangrovihabitans endophyticus]
MTRPATSMTVRDAVFDFFRQAGIDTVFGNPGSTELRMLRDWPSDLRYVLALQESVAVAAAAGHALGTGRAGVASLHSAGGVGHSLGAVFNAYRDRVPVLVIAGQQTREMLPTRPFLAADEPATFPRPYVKWSAQPERAQDVPAAIAEAYRTAMSPPRGPVFVSVPEDDWDQPAEPVEPRTLLHGFTADRDALRVVAEAVNAAARPALVIGAGVDEDDAQALAVEFAERATAAVWLTPLSARSGFPETHRLFRGFLPPVRDQIVRLLDGHDVVVSVGGPIFKYHVHSGGPFLPAGTSLFQLDCDPAQAAWAPAGTSVLTTVRAGLAGLLELVEKRDRPEPPARVLPPRPPLRDPIDPGLAVAAMRELIGEQTVVVEEIPSHRETFHARFPITRPGGFLTTGSGALGWGLPVAVGRALAGGGERVVCVAGDGSCMYSIQALWTASRYRAPVTFVVLNNGGYEAVKQLGRRLGTPRTVGTDIPGLDLVAVAGGLGCAGARVADAADLPDALAAALAADGPYLLDVPVSAGETSAYAPDAI